MGWFSPQSIFAFGLSILATLAASAQAQDTSTLEGIGHSYFQQETNPPADSEFVNYLLPGPEIQSQLGTLSLLELPELPPVQPLPEPKPEETKPAAAEEVDKPDAKEKSDPAEEKATYGYFEYVPYGQYYHVDYWLGKAVWKNSAELGLNGQTGNTESNSLRVGSKIRREGAHTIFSAEVKHLRTSGPKGLTQNNAYMKHKLEWPLKIHDYWALYENTNLEYDQFKAFDLRLVFNGGASYKLYKTDRTDLTLSAGAGFNQEFGSPQKGIVPEANFGTDLSHSFSEGQKLEVQFDIYPSMEVDQGYRHTTNATYTIALNHGLSLKLSAQDRYDSTPNGRKRNDLDYACLLLWEF